MKRLSVLLLVFGIASIAHGMAVGPSRRAELLESLDGLRKSYQLSLLWNEFTHEELVVILTTALVLTDNSSLLRELQNPSYSYQEKIGIISNTFKEEQLIEILRTALIVKMHVE